MIISSRRSLMNISANLSSMQANQTFMNNNANNIANVNTDGFIPKETVITNPEDGVLQANSKAATDTGSAQSQTDLSKELTDQITIEAVNDVNIKTIQTQNDMLGSLLDIKA